MKFFIFCLMMIAPGFAHASASCGGEIVCDPEQVQDNRSPLQVAQPTPPDYVKGSCGTNLPRSQSYNAQIQGVTCGEAAREFQRFPHKYTDDQENLWYENKNSSLADKREGMQDAHRYTEGWSGTMQVPMTEHWTYQFKRGGYRGSLTQVNTTCSIHRTRHHEFTNHRDGDCIRYEQLPDDPPPEDTSTSSGSSGGYYGSSSGSGSGRSSGGGYYGGSTSGSSSGSSSRGSSTGSGESKSSLRSAYGRRGSDNTFEVPAYAPQMDQAPVRTELHVLRTRMPSKQGACLEYEQIAFQDYKDTDLGDYTFDCTRGLPSWTEWLETQSVSAACPNMQVKYNAVYTTDPKWVPGYVDAKNPARSYNDFISNKFDLLPGESEKVTLWVNTGESSVLRPSVVVPNYWNDYSASVTPIRCEFNSNATMQFKINTIGRNVRNAPNPLQIPADKNGRPVALNFDLSGNGKAGTDKKGQPITVAAGKPVMIGLYDQTRAMMLAASELSQEFGRPSTAPVAPPKTRSILERMAGPEKIATVNDGKFDAHTNFRIQLFRIDHAGKLVRITRPKGFNEKQAQYEGSDLKIPLVGLNPIGQVYRPAGLLGPIFDKLPGVTEIAFTPGWTYLLKIRAVSQGLPFYVSGCRGGAVTCTGENLSNMTVTDPIVIQWQADKSYDHRSMWRKYTDMLDNSTFGRRGSKE